MVNIRQPIFSSDETPARPRRWAERMMAWEGKYLQPRIVGQGLSALVMLVFFVWRATGQVHGWWWLLVLPMLALGLGLGRFVESCTKLYWDEDQESLILERDMRMGLAWAPLFLGHMILGILGMTWPVEAEFARTFWMFGIPGLLGGQALFLAIKLRRVENELLPRGKTQKGVVGHGREIHRHEPDLG